MKKRKNESGQAIIEFLIVMCVILTLIFMFVQISWSIAFGHYAHYATYMASRAYLSGGLTQQDQTDGATSILKSMLKKSTGEDLLPFVGKARAGDERDIQGAEPIKGAFIGTHPEAQGKEHSRPFSWAEGVQYNFAVSIFLLPLASWVKKEGTGKTIQTGSAKDPNKAIEFKGYIPFTSDSFLGREPSVDECFKEMSRISTEIGIGRADGQLFIEDNGC